MFGKIKENRFVGQKFSEWVQEKFPGFPERSVSDVLWFASNSETLSEIPSGMADPICIKRWFNEQEVATPPTPDLTLTTPSRLTASIEQVAPQAKRINKLVAMAELGEGQEKETAQRYLNKKAKEFGMEAGELSNLSRTP